MKINKNNPLHWLLLIAFSLNVALATILRPLSGRMKRTRIILYGHKLNGNLLVLYRHFAEKFPHMQVRFLTMDPTYRAQLRDQGVATVAAYSPACCFWLMTARAVIADHGLHAMQVLVRRSSLKFFDVWHGIPFKGFDAEDFLFQRDFDEIWVASPLHKRLYTERYGFPDHRICITGYARTDRLTRPTEKPMDLRARFGLPANDRIVLFAPTWAQDERGRNIYPFGASENEFLEALSATASRNGAKIVLRAHLNSKSALSRVHEAVLAIPQGEYPDTEGLLLVSDVLICDWSSIAFDYLLLKRPTIFLDVPAPFRKSFSLGPEYRFGLIVTDLEELVERLEACLRDPSSYLADARDRHEKAIRDVYDGFADGHSGERCAERLLHHLTTDESFQ